MLPFNTYQTDTSKKHLHTKLSAEVVK